MRSRKRSRRGSGLEEKEAVDDFSDVVHEERVELDDRAAIVENRRRRRRKFDVEVEDVVEKVTKCETLLRNVTNAALKAMLLSSLLESAA